LLGYSKLTKVHNVDEFKVHNKMGTKEFKRKQNRYNPKYPDIPIHRYGVKHASINHYAKPEMVPEMIPELIVPDLEGCQLKPYVSYATKDIYQDELTSQDLFNAIYGPKIVADFKQGKLDENGNPIEPTSLEMMTPDEAYVKARQTGSDIFQGGEPENPLWKLDIPVGKS
jgi:large subunit ribosomal protein L41